MSGDCFISYSRKDSDVADYVLGLLGDLGVGCWIDRENAVAGLDYAASIVKAIKQCSIFILILSKESLASRHVSRELNAAVSADKTIIPIRIDDCSLTDAMEYYLGNTQWIETDGQRTDWKQKTIEALKTALKPVLPKDGRTGAAKKRDADGATNERESEKQIEKAAPQKPAKQEHPFTGADKGNGGQSTNRPIPAPSSGKNGSGKLTKEFISALVKKYRLEDIYLAAGTTAFYKTLQKAINAYAPDAMKERPLLVYDETILGSAKRGFILTENSFIYSIWPYGKHHYAIEELISVTPQFDPIDPEKQEVVCFKFSLTPKKSGLDRYVNISHGSDKERAVKIEAFWKELLAKIRR